MPPIRIASWNLGHQTKFKPLPEDLFPALKCLDADVIVLNEVVLGDKKGSAHRGESLKAEFREKLGMNLIFPNVSEAEARGGFRNHTLVATSLPVERGTLRPDPTLPYATNFVHVRLPDHDLEIAGVRIPMLNKRPGELRHYWNWFRNMIDSQRGKNFIVIGDLNVDPHAGRTNWRKRALKEIQEKGWFIPSPEPANGWSYISRKGNTSRIDHAIVSTTLTATASYTPSANGYQFASKECDMSDHAILLLAVTDPTSNADTNANEQHAARARFLDRISDWTSDNVEITWPDGTTNRDRTSRPQ